MKHITKILLLTFVFTMLITSTCFASNWSSEPLEITDTDFKNIISSQYNYDFSSIDFNSYTGNYSYSKVLSNIFKTSYHKIFYKASDTKLYVFYQTSSYDLRFNYDSLVFPNYVALKFDFENNTLNYENVMNEVQPIFLSSGWKSGADLTTEELQTTEYQKELVYNTFFYVAGSLNSSSGTSLIEAEEEDPEIGGDIMGGETTLSFPEHEYAYWEGVIHQNNGATYAVLLVSNDPFSADNFLYREGSGDTQDMIRFSASAEDEDTNYLVRVYVLQPDGTWLFSSGSSYTGTSMAHNFNVGTVIMTTKNIENEDGTIFFPLTPVETLEGLGMKILEAMAKITIVAVSCLVLLISLQVLLRVLRIYLA